MRSNALFFPYISFPNESWTIKTLLYWDKLSSIIPFEYVENPESLGEFTNSLIKESLVEQVFPGQYIYNISNFESVFIDYIENYIRAHSGNNYVFMSNTSRIHAEKLGSIPRYLTERGLAKRFSQNWYDVDSSIADIFMTYLATCLGAINEVNATPVTNSSKHIRLFNHEINIKSNDRKIHHEKAREVILRNLLPIPDEKVSIYDLLRFKEKHQNLLPGLRRKVEMACADIAVHSDPEHRLIATEDFINSCTNEVNEITDAMSPFWRKLKRGSISGLLGSSATFTATLGSMDTNNPVTAIAAIGAGYSLKSSIDQIIDEMQQNHQCSIDAKKQPLAYIAHARSGFYK